MNNQNNTVIGTMHKLSLDQFIFEASIATDSLNLQDSWMKFISNIGASGYRIVPTPQHLLQLFIPLIKVGNDVPINQLLTPDKIKIFTKKFITFPEITHKAPPGWLEHYYEQKYYFYDPIVKKAIIERGPFTREEALKQYYNPQAERLAADSKAAGMRDGISMSQWFGPDVLVGFTIHLDDANIIKDQTIKYTLKTAAFVFYARLTELTSHVIQFEEQMPHLTFREADVLHWIAVGKTKQEIAEILQISTSSIKRHCENINQKLGVNNMASAVARAMSYGLIIP